MKDTFFTGVKEKNKSYKFKSFLDDCEFFSCAECSCDRIIPILLDEAFTLSIMQSNVSKIYNIDGKLYYYFSNGYLYEGNGNVLKKVTENKFLSVPIVLKAPRNFGDSILIVDEKNALVRGEFNGNVYLPKGQEYLIYEDTVFLFDKNSLFFDCHVDDKFLLKDDFFGRIDVSNHLGNIVHLEVIENELIVFCEYGISTLSILDDKKDYKLYDTVSLPLSIRENSIKRIGDECYFICGKKLCKYGKGKFNFVPFFLEEKDYTIVSKSFCIDDLYCLPINYNSSNFVYEYSILTGNQKIADLNGKLYTDGGYLYDIATRKILKLEEGVNQLFTWKSKSIDFGNTLNKFISSICILGEGYFNVTLNNGVESKTYVLYANKELLRLNFQAKSFTITVTSLTMNSCIDEIRINYNE